MAPTPLPDPPPDREDAERRSASLWPWLTAWSAQGGALLLVDGLGLLGEPRGFVLAGLLAAIPLAGLYGWQRRARR